MRRSRSHVVWMGSFLVGVPTLIASGFPRSADAPPARSQGAVSIAPDDHASMDMEKDVHEWYQTHSQTPSTSSPAAGPVDTFFAGPSGQLRFDADGNLTTAFDTVRVQPGETVLWKWVSGSHTTTNGLPGQPTAGNLWDHALTSSSQEFAFVFPDSGTFSFFCTPHSSSMRGAVVVRALVGVSPLPGAPGRLGFVAGPSPNPARERVTFRIGLRQAGRARVEVIDARGRLVAQPVDQVLEAGTYGAFWDGNTRSGMRAAPGVYYLRLTLPGGEDRRTFVWER